MRKLRARTQGLVLLTATPMQVHPVEVWDLLDLLGLPPEWTADAFLKFFDDLDHPSPSPEALERMAHLFRAVERDFGTASTEAAQRVTGLSRLKTVKVLRALRDAASIPRRQMETPERRAALALVRAHTPIRRLVSRHTRELLRRYFKSGMLSTPIAERRVEDRFIDMTPAERELYDAVEAYIAHTYDKASGAERSAVGFVMTIYRRRLASSFAVLRSTFENRLETMACRDRARLTGLDDDVPDDEAADEFLDADEVAAMERQALDHEERVEIGSLLDRVRILPPDSKMAHLKEVLAELRRNGYRQAMVFTQYTDTLYFLREELLREDDLRLMCFSGRSGEIPTGGGLQPILAQLPGTISDAVLSGGDRESVDRANVVDEIERRTREAEARGFDIDAAIDEDLTMPVREPSPVTMDDLDRMIGMPDLIPAGADIQPLGHREYGLLAPGMAERLRVTTDPAYFEDHAESVELWSPGSPLFSAPEFLSPVELWPDGATLKDILER